VQEEVLKSDAEQFIESLQQDLPEAGDRSFLVAKDVEQLQQRVQDLQQQVGLTRYWIPSWAGSLCVYSEV
jgi:hypothetical protein